MHSQVGIASLDGESKPAVSGLQGGRRREFVDELGDADVDAVLEALAKVEPRRPND